MSEQPKIPRFLLVNVTQGNIDMGNRGVATSCPIALAVRDRYGDDPVVTSAVRLQVGGYYAFYHHSASSLDFVSAFDLGENVKPRKFVLGLTHARKSDNDYEYLYPHDLEEMGLL